MTKARELIEILCEAVDMNVADFPSEFLTCMRSTEQRVDPRTPHNWLSSNPKLSGAKSLQLIEFWKTRIPDFSRREAALSPDDLRRWLSERSPAKTTAPRHPKVAKFSGSYQVIRPHSTDEKCYVLEAMEIDRTESADSAFFYSHNHRTPDYLYRGEIRVADRYLFALLDRTHERDEGQSAYRSIAFYIGDTVSAACFSGIMTRGTSGDSAGKRAVAMPMIALRVGDSGKLLNATFEPLPLPADTDPDYGLYSVQPDAPLITGEVREHHYPELFHFCDQYLAGPLKDSYGMFVGNPMVLHSIAPATIKGTPKVGLAVWTRLVDSLT